MAAQTTMSQPERGNVTGIVIGLVIALLVLIGLCICTTLLVMKRRSRGVEYSRVSMKEIMDRGTISYVELWEIVKYAKKHGCLDKIEAALKYLNKPTTSASTTQKTDEECYEELCRWKNGDTVGSGQKKEICRVLKKKESGLEDILDELNAFSKRTPNRMSDNNLADLVLEIVESAKVAELLKILGLDDTNVLAVTDSKNLQDVTAAALAELQKWRDGQFEMNPAVKLSLALETVKFSPSDKVFIRDPLSEDDLAHVLKEIGEQAKVAELLKILGQDNTDVLAITDSKNLHDVTAAALIELKKWRDGQFEMNPAVKLSLALETLQFSPSDMDFFREPLSEDDLAHVLWEIGETAKIAELMQILGLDRTKVLAVTDSKNLHDATAAALTELQKWRDGQFEMNPAVKLSLALETLKLSPSEKDFFRVPDTQKTPLAENEIKEYVRAVAGKHCRRLIGALDAKSRDKEIVSIIDENETALFDTTTMLKDWLKHQACSNHNKRCNLRDAQVEKGSADPIWPSDAELRQLQSHVTPSICRKLNIDYASSDDGNFKALCIWRDRAAKKDLTHKHNELLKAFKVDKLEGLLPRFGGTFVYTAELIDLAFQLILEDVIPFAKTLGISETRMVSYRPRFDPLHLERGTIGQLIKVFDPSGIFDTNKRPKLCNTLRKLGYPYTARKGMIACNISYGEMCGIADALRSDDMNDYTLVEIDEVAIRPHNEEESSAEGAEDGTTKNSENKTTDVENEISVMVDVQPSPDAGSNNASIHQSEIENENGLHTSELLTNDGKVNHFEHDSTQAPSENEEAEKSKTDDRNIHDLKKPAAPTSGLVRSKTSKPHAKISTDEKFSGKVVQELQQVLQLHGEKSDENNDYGPADILELLRAWKEMPRLQPFNYRAALADGLKRFHRDGLAKDVIQGKHKGYPSFAFTHDIVTEMDTDQRIDLRQLLGFSTKKGEWRDSTDKFAEKLHTAMLERAASMKKMKPGGFKDIVVRFKEIKEQHVEFNDRLVKHGFLDLAREMMIIETQLLDEKGEGIY